MSITITLLYNGDTKSVRIEERDLYDANKNIVAILVLRYTGWWLDGKGFQMDDHEIIRQTPDETLITIDLDKYEQEYVSQHPYVVDASTNTKHNTVLHMVRLLFRYKNIAFTTRAAVGE